MFDSPLIREVTLKDFLQTKSGIKMKNIQSGVLFVGAHWCGHCQSMKKDIEKIAVIGGIRMGVSFLDGAKPVNKQLLNLLDVSGFPTVFIIKKNKLVKYNGARDHISILHELCKSDDKMCFL